MKYVHVAVGVIIDSENRVCIALRPEGKHLAGFWEFPGGKVETGESVFDALKRELFEELSLEIISSQPLTIIEFEYPEKNVCLDVHVVRQFSGEAKGQELQEVKWVHVEELRAYNFPEANGPIVAAIERLNA